VRLPDLLPGRELARPHWLVFRRRRTTSQPRRKTLRLSRVASLFQGFLNLPVEKAFLTGALATPSDGVASLLFRFPNPEMRTALLSRRLASLFAGNASPVRGLLKLVVQNAFLLQRFANLAAPLASPRQRILNLATREDCQRERLAELGVREGSSGGRKASLAGRIAMSARGHVAEAAQRSIPAPLRRNNLTGPVRTREESGRPDRFAAVGGQGSVRRLPAKPCGVERRRCNVARSS
jgi:hypothetical protein